MKRTTKGTQVLRVARRVSARTFHVSLALIGFAAGIAVSLAPQAVLAQIPTPTVSLPPVGTHGFPFNSEVIDFADYGFVEEEVFIEGVATSYVPVNAPLSDITDGRWNATRIGPTAAYKTRLLIRRPSKPNKFNGVVFVDWLNVSSGYDSDVFGGLSSELMREGYAYVGVSAQAVGVNFLRNTWETGEGARYASLAHPGDSFSYDIFSQAARAILEPKPGDPAPLGKLTNRITSLMAHGASQSGARLFTYVNAVQPTANVYNGFLILVTNGGSVLSQAPLPVVPVPTGARALIRADSETPVLYINTETEFVNGARGIHSQPDNARLRLWEITGGAHATRPGVEASLGKYAKSGLPSGVPDCGPLPINDMDVSVAVKGGVHALRRWLRGGSPPISAPRAELVIPADPTAEATIVRDPYTGIANGGLRYPDIDVPIRTLRGVRPPAGLGANPACFLFGATDPWNRDGNPYDGDPAFDLTATPEPNPSELHGKRSRYVSAVRRSAAALVDAGYMRPYDAKNLVERAKGVDLK